MDAKTKLELHLLIIQALEEDILPEDEKRLINWMMDDPEARAYYLDVIDFNNVLQDIEGFPKLIDLGTGHTGQWNIEIIDEMLEQEEQSKKLGFLSPSQSDQHLNIIEEYANRKLQAFLEQEHAQKRQFVLYSSRRCLIDIIWDLFNGCYRIVGTAIRTVKTGLVIATILLVIGIVGLSIQANRIVATLGDSVHAQWKEEPQDTQLRRGWLALQEGFAQVHFKKGAELVLQAPCRFKLKSGNRIFLKTGSVAACVPEQALGFTIETPGSDIVDFGTEFGVLAREDSSNETYVFDGKVGVKSRRDGRLSKTPEMVTEGRAVAVDDSGQLSSISFSSSQITRSIPDSSQFGIPGKRLDLADIVGGGNGLGTGKLNQVIDSTTGLVIPFRELIESPEKRQRIYNLMSTNEFIATSSNLFIDGVFVPDGGLGKPVVISSTGLVFENCPDTTGYYRYGIVKDAMFEYVPFPPHLGRLRGKTYGVPGRPSIGMHANVGITFDLDKIRSAMPGVKITRFKSLCGISETIEQYSNGYRTGTTTRITVDFWILVDGRIRFWKKLTAVPHQAADIDIELGDKDRFLTLVTTDYEQFYNLAWGMFAEPMLQMTVTDKDNDEQKKPGGPTEESYPKRESTLR
ncbi:MAG: NPCBM/NEW2 domain-containing protein [Sedimentisphaerales bacterium]|nr:NPCBM/NEW2 domain-containing protein [Sedimentisphaerales bacterium]